VVQFFAAADRARSSGEYRLTRGARPSLVTVAVTALYLELTAACRSAELTGRPSRAAADSALH
jgi:hypothetical protein